MQTRVVLLQHGEKERLPGDPGLTPTGHRQAESAAAVLRGERPAAVVCSPLLRARQTAAAVGAACGVPVDVDARLTERLGWQPGQDAADFLRVWAATTEDRRWAPPGGRSSAATAADLGEALDDHCVTGRTVVLVGHGGATCDLLRDLLGDEELERRAPGLLVDGVPGGALSVLSAQEGRWLVRAIADVSHLAADQRTAHDPGSRPG